jgi:FkbM family methyltransferase
VSAVSARAGTGGFSLRPLPERAGRCPRCDRELGVNRLRLPGWRALLDGTCESCGHRYLQDLPAGHGLVYPATLDLDTGDVFDPAGASWFSSWLRPAWEQPDGRPVALAIDVREQREHAVLLACLDPIYGHSLLKLLNVQRELAGDAGVVVLVPSSLSALVPDGVAEVWTVDERPGRFRGWLLDLEERLGAEVERFGALMLSPAYPHPHPSTYDLDALVGGIEPERGGDPSVVLSVRDDRLWGRDQRRNVERLVELVALEFPGASFTAVGVGGESALPAGVADLRSQAPADADERRWLALMRGADLAIGVHGSNMLLPSGLARATLELIGEERYGNVFQGTLLAGTDPFAALGAHRVVYGDAELGDVRPERVAAVALSILREGDRFERLMTGAAAGQGGHEPVAPIAASPAPAPPPAPRLRPSPARVLRRAAAAATERFHRDDPLPEPPAVLADRRGLRFELVTAAEIEEFTRHAGHFEGEEIDIAARLLAPGGTAVDVGANIGAFTAALASAVAPDGTVHAFEPVEASRRRLERTLELNGLTNVIVDPRAVADAEGSAELFEYGPGYESWASLADRSVEHGDVVPQATATAVATTTLDIYATQAGIERIDLLKVDVEGAEERVLRGARGLLEAGRVAAVVLELSDNTLDSFGARAFDVVELLEGYGLRLHVVRDGALRGFRVAGAYRELANVFALSAAVRERVAEVIA